MVKLENSIRQREWILPEVTSKDVTESFPELSALSLSLLTARKLETAESITQFLAPEYPRDLHAPRLLGGIDRATGIITLALKNKTQILIYGDYDVDGVSAAALLNDVLLSLGGNVSVHIPHRYADGYGLSVGPVQKKLNSEKGLIITVDCGITAVDEVADLQKNGHQVVITDHHLPGDTIPKADAVINPNLPGDPYPNKALSGVGVAFKLASAILAECVSDALDRERQEKWLLDLVALGTVADVSYQSPENRTLVKYGLIVLGKTKRPGLRSLVAECGIKATPSSEDIGFRIAPRLNAVGRLDDARVAYDLLSATSLTEGAQLSQQLSEHNQRRQQLVDQALSEARLLTQDTNPLAIASGPWERGIVGLIAGRLAEEQQRPALVASTLEQTYYGSARSVGDVDIAKLLMDQRSAFKTIGGHTAAAGFSALSADWNSLVASLQRAAQGYQPLRNHRPLYFADAEIKLDDVTVAVATELGSFAPYGPGNPEPLLVIRNVELVSVQPVGSTMRHARMSIKDEAGNTAGAIAFGLGESIDLLRRWRQVDLLGKIRTNTFRGQTKAELEVVDARASQ